MLATLSSWRGTQLKFIDSYDYEWCFPCVTGKVESGFRNGNIIKEPLCIGQWEKNMITMDHESQESVFNSITN